MWMGYLMCSARHAVICRRAAGALQAAPLRHPQMASGVAGSGASDALLPHPAAPSVAWSRHDAPWLLPALRPQALGFAFSPSLLGGLVAVMAIPGQRSVTCYPTTNILNPISM